MYIKTLVTCSVCNEFKHAPHKLMCSVCKTRLSARTMAKPVIDVELLADYKAQHHVEWALAHERGASFTAIANQFNVTRQAASQGIRAVYIRLKEIKALG